MRLVKRWGVMTLVALLVLGTMGAALADDDVETEAETAKDLLEEGSFAPAVEWAGGLVQFMFYWGYEDDELPAECSDPEAGDSGLFGLGGSTLVTDGPECLNVEKNGHYNHGSMVSAVVHWLKDGNLEDVLETLEDGLAQELRDMPKGQLVKMFAHEDFGKGNFDPEATLEAAEAEVEESDGHGPPEWVLKKKAEKAAEKANKGNNK